MTMTAQDILQSLRVEEKRILVQRARENPNDFYRYVMRPGGAEPELPPHMIAWGDHFDWYEKRRFNIGLIAPPITGKTEFIISRLLRWIGEDSNERVAIVCQKDEYAQDRVEQVSKYITDSMELRDVYPNLVKPQGRATRDERWTKKKIQLDRKLKAHEATVEAHGFSTKASGKHYSRIIFDDPTDENDKSRAIRLANITHYQNVWRQRLVPGGRMYLIIQRRWARDDLVSELMKDSTWRVLVQGITDDLTALEQPPDHLFRSDIYPAVRLACKKRQSFPIANFMESSRHDWISQQKSHPISFGQTWQQKTRSELDRVFDDDCLRMTFNWELSAEKIQEQARREHWPIIITSDFSKKNRRGSVVMVSAFHPASHRRFILDLKVGEYGAGTKIAGMMCDMHAQWCSQGIYVEDMALQSEPFIEWVETLYPHMTAMVKGITAHKKWDPEVGVPSLAAEMSKGQWCIPLFQIQEMRGGSMAADNPWARLHYEFSEYPGCSDDVIMAAWMAQKVFRSCPEFKSSSAPAIGFGGSRREVPAMRPFSNRGGSIVVGGGSSSFSGLRMPQGSGAQFGFRRH